MQSICLMLFLYPPLSNIKDIEACIMEFTSHDSASLARKTPPSYQGFEVILSNIGEVKAQ